MQCNSSDFNLFETVGGAGLSQSAGGGKGVVFDGDEAGRFGEVREAMMPNGGTVMEQEGGMEAEAVRTILFDAVFDSAIKDLAKRLFDYGDVVEWGQGKAMMAELEYREIIKQWAIEHSAILSRAVPRG